MKRIVPIIIVVVTSLLGCDDLIEKDIENKRVAVVSPGDGVTAAAGEVVFLWKPLESATEYHLTIVSPDFGKPSRVVADTVMPDSVLVSYSFRQRLEAGDYEWNIRARNFAYTTRDNIRSLQIRWEDYGDEDEQTE